MNHQSDWDTLKTLHTMLTARIDTPLAEALSLLNRLPAGTPRDTASKHVDGVYQLYQAWSALVDYKAKQVTPPTQAINIRTVLEWITQELEIKNVPTLNREIDIEAHRPSLQEALILLHSVAARQGSHIQLMLNTSEVGCWFWVKFFHAKPLPNAISSLIANYYANPQHQETALELQLAQDFIAMNGGKLAVKWERNALQGAFNFFITKVDVDTHPLMDNNPEAANTTLKPPQKSMLTPNRAPTKVVNLAVEPLSDEDTQPLPALQKPADDTEEEITKPDRSKLVQSAVDDEEPTIPSKSEALLKALKMLDQSRRQQEISKPLDAESKEKTVTAKALDPNALTGQQPTPDEEATLPIEINISMDQAEQ